MVTLIDREFTVNVSRERAWDYLVRLDLWPTWAPHIKSIGTHPPGELGPNSSGVIHLANGMKSTFHMTEFNRYDNWKWVGPFLWLTIHYDHRFESVSSNQTRLRFVLDASGFGVGFFGRLFARIYSRNLEKAILLLVKAMELAYPK
jgi:Polyketide cyclase / dehydrase and lipid transport